MNVTVEVEAAEIKSAWIGQRGSGDMMTGRTALVLRFPDVSVEIVGHAGAVANALRLVADQVEEQGW